MFNNFPSENLTVYEIMWKNTVEPDGPQIRTWLLPSASCIPKATNTLIVSNNYRFSTATVVQRTRLSGALYVHCLSC